MKPGMKHLKSTACAVSIVLSMLVGNVQAQQVPIPQTPAEVPGPAPGTMTKAYVQMVGRMAYFWGWPLVYVYNQRTELTKAPEVGLLAGVLPISPMNQVGMLTGYIDPGERFIADPNQDVVYGLGYLSLRRSRWSFKCPTLATVSGRSRCTTHAPPDERAWSAVRHQARVLHGCWAELERRDPGRHCRRGALVHRLRRDHAAHLHNRQS